MDITKLQTGKNPQEGLVNVFIEIPKDGDIKYELDKDSGIIMVDRFLHTAMTYPFNYGFVPGTLAEDGDPLDILVLSDRAVLPGTVMPCQIIGMLEMEDEAGIDTKVLAVPTKKIDPLYGVFQDITDVPEAITNKVKHFFENYKTLEPEKWVKVKEWKNKSAAIDALKNSMK